MKKPKGIDPNQWAIETQKAFERDCEERYAAALKPPIKLEPRKADTHTKIEIVKAFLRELSPEHRLEAMSEVCEYCGDLRPKGGCNCMRDE